MPQRVFVPRASVAERDGSQSPRFALGGATLIALALLVGCGSREKTPEAAAQVSGTVTVMGRPVGFGTVRLLSSGTSWEAKLDRAGKFKIQDSLPPGEYLVYLRSDDGGTHRMVPVKYQSDTSTDYRVSVKSGKNDLAIDLK